MSGRFCKTRRHLSIGRRKTADSAERANLANSAQEQAEAAFTRSIKWTNSSRPRGTESRLRKLMRRYARRKVRQFHLRSNPSFTKIFLQKVDANVREAVRRIQAAQPTSQAAAQPAVPGAQPQSPQSTARGTSADCERHACKTSAGFFNNSWKSNCGAYPEFNCAAKMLP